MNCARTLLICFLLALPLGAQNKRALLFQRAAPAPAAPAGSSDNFDSYSNGADVDGLANWEVELGPFVIRKPASDGQIRCDDASGDDHLARYVGTFDEDQYSEITIRHDGDTTSSYLGVAVRISSGAVNGYVATWGGGGDIFVGTFSSGSYNFIGGYSRAYATGTKLRLEATGNGSATRLTLKEDTGSGWVDVFTSLDPTVYVNGGSPGVSGWGTATDGARGDNWTGGDL